MTPVDTYLGLRAFVDELARCGLRDACTSPGSRSAPLVLSLVRDPRLRCWSHIDERAGGFFAVGAAKASGRPVALVCTSGTAAANFLPAVIEAHEARVPLVVLTADRPPELRDVGAGQTIDQVKLYGSAAKWFAEIDEHPATPARQRWLRMLACRAYWTALEGRPGVVHLNFALREPLVLDAPLPPDEPGGGGRPGGRPWLDRPRAAPGESAAEVVAEALRRRRRAVLVAGRFERDAAAGAALARFAERAGLPLLAEPLSGARRGAAAIAHYDLLLRVEPWTSRHVPDLVLRVGDVPTSKPLRLWLAGLPAPGEGGAGTLQIAFDPESAWQDPSASAAVAVAADPAPALAQALGDGDLASDPDWLASWRAADAAAANAFAAVLDDGLSEPQVAAELMRRLPPDATLFVASSMPVRDVEIFGGVREDPPRVLSNRGANGIDGLVSSAFGAAAAGGPGPTVLLIGDVALAHDVGGLLAGRRLGLDLTIVLLHNDGGGIFHFLPVAEQRDAFEEHVATPHGLDFAHAAALYGAQHTRARDLEELRAALDGALARPGTDIVEVRTDRVENRALHARVADAVAAALAAPATA